jgi:hypothetical protein
MGTVGRIRTLVALLAAGLALAGCATTSLLPGHHQSGTGGDAAQVAVVRHWAAALRAGDLRGAAGYFHLPSVFENGATGAVEIRTLAQAEAVNSTLSCGAQVVSAFREGRYINVLFRLTARAGRGGGAQACGSGVGQTARTKFLIRGGEILAWVRAPSRPGDPGAPTTRTGSSGTPI